MVNRTGETLKRRTKRTRRLDNRGLTLVELLVAVVILGIIVAPLLHTFATSAKTAQKSRQFGDATTAAQNIIELIESSDTDVILSNATVIDSGASFYKPVVSEGVTSFVVSAAAYKDTSGKYYIGLPVSSGSSSFDALITLDASDLLNGEPVTQYTELIATSQAAGTDNPDNKAKADFAWASELLGSETPTENETLSRNITITVEPGETSGGTVTYQIVIVYRYSGGFNYTDVNDDYKYYNFYEEYTSETFYTGIPDTVDFGEPVFSMFYFFAPFYSIYGSSKDIVYVYNRDNAYTVGANTYDLRFNLFLIRQKTISDAAELSAAEASYSSAIYQYETYGLGTSDGEYLNACKVYTNMNTNLSTGADLSSFEYRVYRGASMWYYPGTEDPRLVVSDRIDRLIYLDVQLFESGEADSGFTGTPIASMNATKLD